MRQQLIMRHPPPHAVSIFVGERSLAHPLDIRDVLAAGRTQR
jgi:hypothetical protein